MPMRVWVYSRGPPFSYPTWIQLFNGWSTCGCLAAFPRLKGRVKYSLFFLLIIDLLIRDMWSTIIPEVSCKTAALVDIVDSVREP
jgi:hypothetical protein